jgi:metal-dependent HD superfamily phosphatase/phosphodiesterase
MFNIKTNNSKLKKVIDNVENNKTLQTLWVASGISADRMGLHDHGKSHVKIVAEFAMAMLEYLNKKGKVTNVIKNYKLNKNVKKFDLDYQEDEVIVFLASCLHDIGMTVHKEKHGEMGVYLANNILDDLLEGVYEDEEKTIIKSEVLHCILVHHNTLKPLTLEASIVKVADALDMAKGRARIPYNANEIDAHSVSALAIDKVNITTSDEKPIVIEVVMNDSAGVFKIKELLNQKLKDSHLERYVKIIGVIKKGSNKEKIVFEL